MFSRIISNTAKHIKRSGWIGVGSTLVVTLSFFIMSVFAGLAYISNLYIKFIESRSNIIVFFEVGIQDNTTIIQDLKAKWETLPQVKSVGFTSEQEAYEIYSDYSAIVIPETYAVLRGQEQKRLNSSLDIQLTSLEDFEGVVDILQEDIDAELENLKIMITPVQEDDEVTVPDTTMQTQTENNTNTTGSEQSQTNDADNEITDLVATDAITYKYSEDPSQPPIVIGLDSESLETQRNAFAILRVGGVVVISLLATVIFFLIFMTVEFRLYNQMEEIGVMQLVGGSLFFIRAPYILENGFYGFIGSMVSTGIIGSIYLAIFEFEVDKGFKSFLQSNFVKLPWPQLSIPDVFIIVFTIGAIGFILGAISSYLSISRYIR